MDGADGANGAGEMNGEINRIMRVDETKGGHMLLQIGRKTNRGNETNVSELIGESRLFRAGWTGRTDRTDDFDEN